MINVEEAILTGKKDKEKQTLKNLLALEQHLQKSVAKLDTKKVFQKISQASQNGQSKVCLFRFYCAEKFWFYPSYRVTDLEQVFEVFRRLRLDTTVLQLFKTNLNVSLTYEAVQEYEEFDFSRNCGKIWLQWTSAKENKQK